jgi:hypothetical protein
MDLKKGTALRIHSFVAKQRTQRQYRRSRETQRKIIIAIENKPWAQG